MLALEKNSSSLSSIFTGGGLYKRFGGFELDMSTRKFSASGECLPLEYIRSSAHITIEDMFSFRQAKIERLDRSTFFGNYKRLRTLYRQSPRAWKELCGWLSTASNEVTEILASFNKLPSDRAAVEADKFKADFDRLFGNRYARLKPSFASSNVKNGEVSLRFESLNVRGLRRHYDLNVINLLNDPVDMKFITNLHVSETVSFTYASYAIKSLLTVAGKILEVYVYHKPEASGMFDDITCGCEISWQNTAVRSEFDCIVTHGFQSMFVECKARSRIEQEFYYKLSGPVREFGINAKAVMIADTREKPWHENAQINDVNRLRGELQNVETIWKLEDIERIDEVLLEISTPRSSG